MKKISVNRILSLWKYIKTSFKRSGQAAYNGFILCIAILALLVAIKTMNQADTQFKQNTKTSDSLFHIQFQTTKTYNDSLLFEINQLNRITNKQLEITDAQLTVSAEILQDRIYENRPKIVIVNQQVSAGKEINDSTIRMVLSSDYSNWGKRNAKNLKFRSFLIYKDFSGGHSSAENDVPGILGPNASKSAQFVPILLKDKIHEFYYLIDVFYFDEKLQESFYDTYISHCYKFEGKYTLQNCNDVLKKELIAMINDNLNSKGLRKFGK